MNRTRRTARLAPMAFLIAAAAALPPSEARAWGVEGHRIVGFIAEANLTGEARTALAGILGGERLSDDAVANWADRIRATHRETGPWHYVDIPYEAKGFDPARDGRNGDTVVGKIRAFTDVLRNPSSPPPARQEAVRYLVHLVGDVHQPLHCCERNDFVGRGDRGGNAVDVMFPGREAVTNLHAVWDSLLLGRLVAAGQERAFAESLLGRLSAARKESWAQGTPEQWATESHASAVREAYDGVRVTIAPVELTEDYVVRNGLVVERQLLKAGLRLARLLSESLHR